ncbi:MAG: hypothetical protein FJ399_19290, partial [Verrucomicrobia bacterium]|nr:hypothetical protein [Verrucomicrobiota bacterium]
MMYPKPRPLSLPSGPQPTRKNPMNRTAIASLTRIFHESVKYSPCGPTLAPTKSGLSGLAATWSPCEGRRKFSAVFISVREISGLIAATLGCLAAPTTSEAQTVAPPPKEGAVVLSPFQVSTDRDSGYAASTAMTGTRTNEKLENLPNSISVMTQELLQDLAFNNYFDAVDFGMSTENQFNDQGTIGAVVGNRSGNQVNIRGLASIRQLRDGFPWYLAADVFNTERIEISRGPSGLAFGDVDAGGP